MTQTVFVLLRNADMTEGRGPMEMHSIWSNRAEAASFMDRQSGVMGRPGPWSNDKYGDWALREMPIHSSAAEFMAAAQADLRTKALGKLTEAERAALGLSQ